MKFDLLGHGMDSLHRSQSALSLSRTLSIFNPVRGFLGGRDGPPDQPNNPLLCLNLSSPSFLECTIIDTATADPLYRIKTSGTTTTVSRRESISSSVVASSIKWPKIIPMKRTKARPELVLVLMRDGPWRGGGSLLKPSSRENSRKFRLPNHNYPMKWKLHGGLYWCTTPSIHGAIATLDPRKGIHPPKLTVYENFHDRCTPHEPVHRGVSVTLLDYLVVTALLLVTDLQEWALVPRPVYSKFPLSEQVEFGSANPWKEFYPIRNRSSSSIRTGPSPPPGFPSSLSSHTSQWLDSYIDPESEHEDARRSLSPVSEVLSPAIQSDSSYLLHHRISPTQRSAVSEPPYRTSCIANRGLVLHRPASDGLRKVYSTCRPSIRSSFGADDVDGNVLSSVPQPVSPLRRTESEREPIPHNHRISSIRRNPRPLPLLPTVYRPDEVSSGSSRELIASSSSSHHRPTRTLPMVPPTSSQLAVPPTAVNGILPKLQDGCSCQPLHAVRPTDDRQRSITKASRESIAQWLNSLTGDSPKTGNPVGCFCKSSMFDAPPPAYNSSGCSLEHGSQPSSSRPPQELKSEWRR